MKSRLTSIVVFSFLTCSIYGQSLQLNIVPGASFYPQNLRFSQGKIGVGLEFIPGVDERWFFQYQWDFYFQGKNSNAQELLYTQNSRPSGVYTNLSYKVGHVGGQLSINRYLTNDAFTPKGIYVGLGFRFDLFTAKDIQVEEYNDSLYYLFNNFFGQVIGPNSFGFDESQWSSLGMNATVGYLLRVNMFSFRPSFSSGYFFSDQDLELDIKTPKFYMGFDFAIGYIFEDIHWPGGYRILEKRLKF